LQVIAGSPILSNPRCDPKHGVQRHKAGQIKEDHQVTNVVAQEARCIYEIKKRQYIADNYKPYHVEILAVFILGINHGFSSENGSHFISAQVRKSMIMKYGRDKPSNCK
jgi:hypothetical protein